MKDYWRLLSRGTCMKCTLVMLLAIMSAYLASVWPVYLSDIYTSLSSGAVKTVARGVQVILPFGIIYLAAELLTIFRRVLLDCIIASHEAEMRQASVEKLLKMPAWYSAGSLSAERTAQLNQGVAGLSQLVKIMCNDVFATVLMAICTLAQVLLNTNWMMGCIMLAYLVLTFMISYFQIRSQNGIREEIIHQKTSVEGHIAESISNLELIRGMHAEVYERNRLSPGIRLVSQIECEHHICMGKYDSLKQFCKIGFQLLILGSSLGFALMGVMEAPAVITACLLFQQLVKPVDDVYRFMDEIASSAVKIKNLQALMLSPHDAVFDIPDGRCIPEHNEIRLKNVVVTTPGECMEDRIPLASYNELMIPAIGSVALKGSTGCGKTTILRAIKRIYPYSQGSITLFGKDLSQYSQKELSDLICYIPQSAFFFAGSIRENLKYGFEKEIPDEQLVDALQKACLLNELKESETQSAAPVLDRYVAEGGKNLSGGQRQRLAMARAFLRKPRLFMLDEITVGLDNITAERVLMNIEQHAAAHHAGILHISHEEWVLKRCSKVIQVVNLLQNNVRMDDCHEADKISQY